MNEQGARIREALELVNGYDGALTISAIEPEDLALPALLVSGLVMSRLTELAATGSDLTEETAAAHLVTVIQDGERWQAAS